MKTYGSWSRVLMMWGHLCKKVKTKVREMGFEPFRSILLLKEDKALLMVLAEVPHHMHLPHAYRGDRVTPNRFLYDDMFAYGG